jgi:hypothetical protein
MIIREIKVGDRVKVTTAFPSIRLKGFKKDGVHEERVEVIQIYEPTSNDIHRIFKSIIPRRYKIELLNTINPEGTNLTRWVSEDDITLDLEYYRNIKLNQLGL